MRSMRGITIDVGQSRDWHTEWGMQRQGSMGDSNFLCSEYDDRADLEANELDSWERDHGCNTRNVTANGKY